MAFGDPIRNANATMEGVATLLETIFSSSYTLSATSYTPTFTPVAGMSMTFSSTFGDYWRVGKFIVWRVNTNFNITVTGNRFAVSLPFTTDARFTVASVNMAVGGVAICGSVQYGGTSAVDIYKFDGSNFATGSGGMSLGGFYTAA